MQQLSYAWLSDHNSIVVSVQDGVRLAHDVVWAQAWCAQVGATQGEVQIGADRWQLAFRWQDLDFLLCCEYLCEAVWIESAYRDGQAQLITLFRHLLEN